ncbi:MAG: hypothetical protein MJZ41_07460 [Bacteroidaceae bacterium]|nr:hypothetical protein [Bacteroidaceae bacterium]
MKNQEFGCKWVFDPQPRGDGSGPANAADLRFRGTIYTSLIRESIQNSMDAVQKNDDGTPKTVKVIIDYRTFYKSEYSNFLDIEEHIKGCLDCQKGDPMAVRVFQPMKKACEAWKDEIGFLRIADFNTTGMAYTRGDKNSPFYAFAHSEGKTVHDDSGAGGAFGFGKTVFWTLSPINTVFATTRTEQGVYFQGISKLCTHTHPNFDQDLARVGLYDTDGKGEPVSDESLIPEDFRRRDKDKELGTSIHVIGVTYTQFSESKEEMIDAVLRNFWLSIMDSMLEVTIDGVKINKETIDNLFEERFANYESTSNDNSEYNPYPFYTLVKNVKNNVDGYIELKGETPNLGQVSIYYYKGEDAAGRILHVRKPEMTIFVSRRENVYKGVTGVFVCRNEEGNSTLREMEDYGHDSWKATNWKARGNQGTLGKTIEAEFKNFIIGIIRDQSNTQDSATQAIKDLEKYLYVSTPYTNENKKKTGEKKVDNEVKEAKTKPTPQKLTGLTHERKKGVPDPNGRMRANERRKMTKRHKINIGPGNMTSVYREDEEGKDGLFATPVELSFRSWAESDSQGVVHIIKLFADKDIDNVCIQLFGVGADGDTPLMIRETSDGTIIQGYDISDKSLIDYDDNEDANNTVQQTADKTKPKENKCPKNSLYGISIKNGQKTIKVRFNSDIKYSLRINADSIDEK